MENIKQAAGICYRWRNDQVEFLLVRNSTNERWLFPKGKIDEGNTLSQTAKIESHEEAGVSGKVSEQPFTNFKHIKHDLKSEARGKELLTAAVLIKVELEYPPVEKNRTPTWFSPKEAQKALSIGRSLKYAEEYRRVIDEALSIITKEQKPKDNNDIEATGNKPVRVFVSYSHQDAKYLEDNSLLGFLSSLTREGFEFWYDKQIKASEIWNERIRAEMEKADIALILVSQAFLNSDYCIKVEAASFIQARSQSGLKIFPVILLPCDWQSHEWLASTQFKPTGGKTIGTHYKDKGKRDALYLEILNDLRQLRHKT